MRTSRLSAGMLGFGFMALWSLAVAGEHQATTRPQTRVQEVIYQGNKHLSKEELDMLTGISKGQPLNPRANQEACRKIVCKLNEAGRPFASCELLSGDTTGDTKVIFNITEGAKAYLRAIYFNGNKWASDGRLMAQIQTKPLVNGVLATRYRPDDFQADIERLREYYKTFGFLAVQITHGIEITEDGRDVIVTYYVDEGPRTTPPKPNPNIVSDRSVPNEQLLQLCSAKPGEYYSEPVVKGDPCKLTDYIPLGPSRIVTIQATQVTSQDVSGAIDRTVNGLVAGIKDLISKTDWNATVQAITVFLRELQGIDLGSPTGYSKPL